MKKLNLCIIIRDTKLWKKGQKVWIWMPTGALAALVIGRFKGKGRWISGWVRIETPPEYEYGHKKPTARWVGEVEISDEFFAYYQKIICRIVGNNYYFNHDL